jgi:hypothetical protein
MKALFQLACLLASLALALASHAQAQEMEEYRLKALFLYNFTQFIEWPEAAFKDPKDTLTICVLGPNPFDHELERTVAGKKIDGHALAWRVIGDPGQAAGCQIVFVSAVATKRAWPLAAGHRASGILTVGESSGFAAGGGVVNFLVKDGRVRLEINVAAAEREKLRISAKLLKLAEIVK